MLSTTDKFACSLSINGYDIEGNLSKLMISSNYKHKLPAMEIIFSTPDDSLRNIIQDSSALVISYSDGEAAAVTRYFRSVSHQLRQSGPMDRHRLVAVLDAPLYLTGCCSESFKGTSSDLFVWIMNRAQLPYITNQTYDNQTWIGSGKRYADLMYRASQSGYVDNASLMLLLPGVDGVMRYLNISNLDYTNARKMSIVGIKPSNDDINYEIPIISWGTRTISGKTNNSLNYNTKLQIQDLTLAGGTGAVISKTPVTKQTERVSVNTGLQIDLDKSPRSIYSSPQSGNNHANYTQAMFQNAKLLSLNSVVTSIMTTTMNTLTDLGSPTDLTITKINATGSPEVDVTTSGKYWVGGKVVFVGEDGQYMEKYDMLRTGNNVSTTGEA